MFHYQWLSIAMELTKYIAIAIYLLIPTSAIALTLYGVILIGTGLIILAVFSLVFVIFPLLYKNAYWLQRTLIFLNFLRFPVNYKNPRSLGLEGTRNFYIDTDDNVTLGVWQILAARYVTNVQEKVVTQKDYETALGNGDPIIVYNHGNSGNRGTGHRLEMYKVLQSSYHVITFDYRSYGDSSSVEPSEDGIVKDSKAVYQWVKSHSKKSKVIIWGHSLGTGVTAHLARILEAEGHNIYGIVLESPFNNMVDEVRSYPLSQLFRHLPWFDYCFTEPMYANGLRFESDRNLKGTKVPVLILHAEDDMVIPITLGRKLYKAIESPRSTQSLTMFHAYKKEYKFGHKYIYKDAKLIDKITEFMDEISKLKLH